MTVAEQAVAWQIQPGLAPEPATSRFSVLGRALVALDATAVCSAWVLAYAFVPAGGGWTVKLGRVGLMTAASLVLVAGQRLYRSRVCSSRLIEVARLTRVAGASMVAGLAVLQFTGGPIAPVPTVIGGVLALAFLTTSRAFYDAWVRAERARGRFTRPVAVVGSGEEAGRVIDLLHHHPELGYRVCGVVGSRATALEHGVPWLAEQRQAVPAALASGATGVVVVAQGFASDELNSLLRDLLTHGLHVRLSSGLWSIDHRRLRVMPLAHEPFLYLEPAALSDRQLLLKRVMDVALASLILLLAAPTMLVAALAVKLGDGGPVLFRQTRVGRRGRPFTLFKFRTMSVDADSRLIGLAERNQRQGPLFKVDADPRVTKVGRFLRATSLDELPQLLNVLGGSMSMVGPRPALPEEVARFDDDLLDRHRVAPGVTGLWQVEARDNASFYAYRHLDLFYVDNWSCALDLVVLASTVPVVVARALRSALGRGEMVSETG